jgi:hypothetical protein
MDTKFQTSFIPKKPVAMTGESRSGGIGLLTLVSIVIFLASLGIAGYVYLQKGILIQSIANAQQTIEKNKGGLVSDSNTVESLVQLNSRINVANDLLSKHVAVSPIFNFLQQATLKSVRFKTFSFSSAGTNVDGSNKVSVQMSGVARDWETIASQADEFGKIDYKNIISTPKVSNLSLNIDGTVSFTFNAFVSPSFLVYGSNTNQ